MPFQRARQHGPVRGTWLIDALEQAGAKSSPINDGLFQKWSLQRRPVEHPSPLAVAKVVEVVGMLEAQQGLGLTIIRLLAQISPGTLSAVMPDHRARSIGDPIAGLLKPPAKVYVVARLSILTIEAVDGFQGFAAKCHVASGNVLGHLVRLQDVSRLPRRGSHTGCQPAIVGSQIGSPDGRGIGALEL